MNARSMSEVIGGVRYDTEKSTLVADDLYWDGHNFEHHGRNTFLYRGQNGSYFAQRRTQWEGERDRLEPLDEDEAAVLWDILPEKHVKFEEAFPNRQVQEA